MSGRRDAVRTVPGLLELARAQHGVVRRDQLRELGVDAHDVGQQVAARRWRSYGPLVVVLHLGPLPRQAEIVAGRLHAGAGSLVAAWTALEVQGLIRWFRPSVHVLVERGTTLPRLPGLVVHESRRLDLGRDRDTRWFVPTVRPARAAIDAAAWTGPAETAVALLAATVQQRITTVEALRTELAAAGAVRHRKTMRLHLGDIAAGSETLGEIRAVRLLAAAGLPTPRRQIPYRRNGRLVRLDLEVDLPDGTVLVLEIDGPDHDEEPARARDALRDLDNLVLARPTLRITPWALRHRREQLLVRLIAVRRAAQLRAAS